MSFLFFVLLALGLAPLRTALRYLVVLVVVMAAVITTQNFIIAVTAALAFLLPLALQFAPAAWKGTTMVLIARVASGVLALAGLYFSGQFDNFDAGKLALYIGAYIALTSTFFDLFKNTWHLSDPPGVNPDPHTQLNAPPPPGTAA